MLLCVCYFLLLMFAIDQGALITLQYKWPQSSFFTPLPVEVALEQIEFMHLNIFIAFKKS